MEQDHLDEILKKNHNIDRTAIRRSRQAAKQLAEAGITLGGYRLSPVLGNAVTEHSDHLSGQGTSGSQEQR